MSSNKNELKNYVEKLKETVQYQQNEIENLEAQVDKWKFNYSQMILINEERLKKANYIIAKCMATICILILFLICACINIYFLGGYNG